MISYGDGRIRWNKHIKVHILIQSQNFYSIDKFILKYFFQEYEIILNSA